MSLIRDLADQIVAAHRKDDLCIPIPKYSIHSPTPQVDNEAASDHYELAGAVAAIEMGFIEKDARVAQIYFHECTSAEKYDGQWQGDKQRNSL